MLSRTTAVERVQQLRTATLADQPAESVPLARIAGRTLAAPLVADADRPPVSRSTMDGYAFDATDPYPLTLRDDPVFPEDDPPEIASGEAVRIFTGAPLPPSANAVLKQEEATVEDGHLHGEPITPGTYAYERGSNVAAGETLFEAGERLSPKDALLLGDLGHDSVEVHERFSVGLLATGTEIHEGRIRDLDSPMLAGLIESWGHVSTHEATGGTSVGDKDHVVRALSALGDVLFHRVRIRPGKPIAVAELPAHDAVAIAIPGKPLGAHVITTLIARPFFTGGSQLSSVTATLSSTVGVGPSGFEYVVPVVLEDGEATPLGHVDSPLSVYEDTFDPSVLSSSTRASRADGFVITETGLSAGDTVDVVPYPVVE
jgi:molybdopterin molybdotransferase